MNRGDRASASAFERRMSPYFQDRREQARAKAAGDKFARGQIGPPRERMSKAYLLLGC